MKRYIIILIPIPNKMRNKIHMLNIIKIKILSVWKSIGFSRDRMSPKSFLGQSAMEYLMTYGWTILLIAIALVALFSLGIFNIGTHTSGSCVANSGYLCSDPIFATNGTLTVLTGESFGPITVTGTACINSTTAPSSAQFNAIIPLSLNTGVSVPLNFYCGLQSNTLGSAFVGTLWLQYTYSGVSGQEVNIAKTTIKATVSGTSSAGTPQTAYYVPITIQNTQNTATSGNFQEMITITESNYASYISFNGNVANFEYVYQNGTIIPSWIESNNSGTLTTWARIAPSIPAQSQIKIYMALVANTMNLLSSSGTIGIGEAPQLSPSYAEYDDGANVFNFYDNFAGTSLNTNKWTETNNGGFTLTVNNGLTMQSTRSNDNDEGIIAKTGFSEPDLIDMYGTIPHGSNGGWSTTGFGLLQNLGFTVLFDSIGSEGQSNIYISPWENSVLTDYVTYSTTPSVWSITNNGVTITSYRNYANSYSSSEAVTGVLYPSYYMEGQALNDYTSYWTRVRAYPPNGIMPSVSFGVLS